MGQNAQEVARQSATEIPAANSHGKDFLESFTTGIAFIGSTS
jgi:hypothetical protein